MAKPINLSQIDNFNIASLVDPYPMKRSIVTRPGGVDLNGFFTPATTGTVTNVGDSTLGNSYVKIVSAATPGSIVKYKSEVYGMIPSYLAGVNQGFKWSLVFSFDSVSVIPRYLIGLAFNNTALGNQDLANYGGANYCALGSDSGDTNMFLFYRPIGNLAITKVNTGFSKVQSGIFILTIERKPYSNKFKTTLYNKTTNTTFTDEVVFEHVGALTPEVSMNNYTDTVATGIRIYRINLDQAD